MRYKILLTFFVIFFGEFEAVFARYGEPFHLKKTGQ